VDRELKRLERASRDSMESQVIRTYLETVTELPWNTRSEEHLDLKQAAAVLDDDHYGLKDVKDRVLEFLAVRQLRARNAGRREEGRWRRERRRSARQGLDPAVRRPTGRGQDLDRQVDRPCDGRKYVRISLAVPGTRRTFAATAGRTWAPCPGGSSRYEARGDQNPVFLLDEVDKLGVSFQGDPAAALLEVLDPAQNDSFTDHYLGVPFDLSEVLFVATANFIQEIPAPLLDRMEVVQFSDTPKTKSWRLPGGT